MTTLSQIEALRAEAGAAGDRAQVAICLRAMGWERADFAAKVEWAASLTGRRLDRDAERAARMTVDQAREVCARVIADAAAQSDEGGAL